MKIYLAGPMRGYPDFNFPAFDEAAKRGRALGHEIVSPAEMDRSIGFNEKGKDGKVNDKGHSAEITPDFMRGCIWRDVDAIVGAAGKPGVDAVAMLPGWEKSRGAKGEKGLAEWLGLDVLDATTFGPLGAPFLKPAPWAAAAAAPIKNGDFIVKDSGKRESFETGAVRDSGEGKGYFHCIPLIAIEALAKLYQAGAQKYGRDNWKKGIPLSRFIDSMARHLFKLSEGWTDEDHGAAVMWNAAGFLWTADAIKRGERPASLNDISFPLAGAM